jgi:hypothetical protein
MLVLQSATALTTIRAERAGKQLQLNLVPVIHGEKRQGDRGLDSFI